MGRRLRNWWEHRTGRSRFLIAVPVSFVVLFAFHEAFFPRLTWVDSMTYALMECVPLALVLVWATENELRQRRAAEADMDGEEASQG